MTNQTLISQFVKKAQSLTDSQKKEILDTHAKVSAWVKSHPNQDITLEMVPDILATRPETPKKELEKMFEPISRPEIRNAVEKQDDFGLKETKLEYEKKISAVQTTQPKMPEITHSMMSDVELAKQVEQAFDSEIDDIYGKKGLFGKTRGVETAEWKFMGSLPAAKVLAYYQSDSANSNLDQRVIQELTDSPKHQNFLKQITTLMNEAQGKVKPYENEAVEVFLKRLGHFVMREHLESNVKLSTLN